VGTIKAIAGNSITLAPDAAAVEVSVVVQDSTRILRVAPGQKDLKDAAPIHQQDLQVGDRIRGFGAMAADNSLVASSIVAMKHADVQAKQLEERQEWQRGVGGLVTAVDGSAGTITISTSSLAGTKTVLLRTSKETLLRRYAPDSVKFDDARPGTLDQVKPGNQLRARGTRSTDGAEFAAKEIVSGAFRNIAGTITSVDSQANTIGVMDLIAKKAVTVKFSSQSQLRKLPPETAQRIALRLKRRAEGLPPTAATSGRTETNPPGPGPPDFQQMLSRLPPATIADFHKGEAVMIVSTEGLVAGQVVAITLLGGVEPILTAAPGSQAMILSPWAVGSPGGEGGEVGP